MSTDQTIFAPLTIKGRCSVYLIRISGNLTNKCLEALGVKKSLSHKSASLQKLKKNTGEILDEALVTYFQSPNSFTGEDVCELNLHCSSYIISEVTKTLLSISNVRLANPGEFSKRAFLNGRMDLLQAESIADLVDSQTEYQHSQAIKQLSGKISEKYFSIRENIVNLLSFLEAYIDFPEEDIQDHIQNDIYNKISQTIEKIKPHISRAKVGEKIREGVKISILGAPNVGKSSLINYLTSRELAIVSDIAGTTRDIIETSININGILATISDTAGIRDTEDLIEKEGVKRAIKNAQDADIKILMISINNYEVNNDILNILDDDTIILLNKIDMKEHYSDIIKEIKFKNVIPISIANEKNMDTFLSELSQKAEDIIQTEESPIITNERHKNLLESALENLKKFSFNLPIEISTEFVRLASNNIGDITGSISNDEILGNIFSKFCIGK